MSEPGAGSDLQSVRTTALRDGNGYRINGAKTFISNGQVADLVIVVAKTDPGEGAKGVSLLVVETGEAEGFRRGSKLDKIGLDAQDTSELFFDDVWVPADNLLGLEEGKGFYQLMAELPRERLLIALGSAVAMEKAIAVTLDYVKERKAFGKPIFDFQNSQFTLADCKAKAVVARVFVNHCIERLLAGALDLPTAAIAKLYGHRGALGGGRRLPSAPRRLRLYQRLSDRPHVARRPGPANLRRLERDHEAADRSLALARKGTVTFRLPARVIAPPRVKVTVPFPLTFAEGTVTFTRGGTL